MAQPPLLDIRPSPIAGRWYPDNPAKLASTIKQYVDSAPDYEVQGDIRGLVVPHAGYRYSGAVAAQAFRLIKGMTFERVVILSPMHHPYDPPLLTTSHAAYQTPLGIVPVDHEVLATLSKHISITPLANDPEHSLEIELPFLQQTLENNFKLVPLMLRDQSFSHANKLGKALAALLGNANHTLLVASSDLSHFYTDEIARRYDELLLDTLAAFDPAGIISLDQQGKAFACGRAAIAATLVAARELGADTVDVVGYDTSATASGDYERVVGYGAAVIYEAD